MGGGAPYEGLEWYSCSYSRSSIESRFYRWSWPFHYVPCFGLGFFLLLLLLHLLLHRMSQNCTLDKFSSARCTDDQIRHSRKAETATESDKGIRSASNALV